jgi:adenylosuccinate lyase
VAVALELREKAAEGNDLLDRLAADSRLRLSRADLDAIVSDPLSFTGAATAQVVAFVQRVDDVVRRHPEAASYHPEPIL